MRKRIALILGIALLTGCNAGGGFGVGTGGTFVVQVGTEQYRVPIESALLATQARRMMVGAEPRKIIVGQLGRGDGGINTGYRWHIKPGTVSFADAAITVCDSRPSDVEANIDYWVDTVKQYCPWGGRFVSEVGR